MPSYLSGARPFRPEDAFALQFIREARLSPDGRYVVYAVLLPNPAKDKDESALYLIDLEAAPDADGHPLARQLTSTATEDAGLAWSPDGKRIAFISARGGPPQIHILDIAGGEAQKVTDLPQGVGSGPVWSPDGKWLAFTAGPQPDPTANPNAPYRIDRHVYRFNSFGYLHRVIQDIYICPATGGTARRITRDACMNVNPRWSPDSREILYVAMFTPGPRWVPGLRVVTLFPPEGSTAQPGDVRNIVWDWGTSGQGRWLPDGKGIVFTGEPHSAVPGTKQDLYVTAANAEDPTHPPLSRTAHCEHQISGSLQGDTPGGLMYGGDLCISPDGAQALVTAQLGGVMEVLRVALAGPEHVEKVVSATERSVTVLDQHGDRLLLAQSSHTDLATLLIFDAGSAQERALTHLNRQTLRGISLPEVRRITAPGFRGDPVEGWLMLPSFGKAPYPCVVVAHGGPWAAFGYTFSADFHLLAGAGFAVLFLNYHGSSGYGSAFGTSLQGDWGTPIFEDHMALIDKAIADGLIDGDRLGINGLSAGGYTTCLLIGHTSRFKAAVAENPVTNLATIRLVGDISLELIDRAMGGSPEQVPDAYRLSSPITNAHLCTTPTLLITGEADWRCPAEQSEQFYAVLKARGCTAEMLRLPNASHADSIAGPLPTRRVQDQALLGWMNRYVIGR